MEKFIEIAKIFISWVEGSNHHSVEELRIVNDLLLSLYSSAFKLKYHPDANELIESRIKHEEWDDIRKGLKDLPFDEYQEIFDTLDFTENSSVIGSLSDDLADIYRDLKPAIRKFENGQKVEAEDDIKRNFEIHWSKHTISALKAIRQYFENNSWGA